MRLGEYKDALAYLQWSMNYPSGSLRVLKKNEIIAHEKLGDFDTALEKIQEYINLYPEDQEALREWEFIKTRIKKPKSE
jgi:tetratricopeptide (TPR) repeat protein